MEPLDVENGGLTFREVVTVTRIEGGVADNVVPAHAAATLNFRYAPGRTRSEAEARLRRARGRRRDPQPLRGGAGPCGQSAPRPLRASGRPLEAFWTLSRSSEVGRTRRDLGPGATRYAHRVDGQVEITETERTFEPLTSFVVGTV